jgi:hypothetical protein
MWSVRQDRPRRRGESLSNTPDACELTDNIIHLVSRFVCKGLVFELRHSDRAFISGFVVSGWIGTAESLGLTFFIFSHPAAKKNT